MATEEQTDRLARAEPGSVEFWRTLLEIAEGSDHPADKRVADVIRREGLAEEEQGDGP